MAKFHKHILICTHERAEGHSSGCCQRVGSEAVLEAFKKQIAEAGLRRKIRANKSGCMDQCSKGPVVVVYPDAVWYGGVQAGDVAEIMEKHVLGGQPVERLQIPDDELSGIPLDN
ncbi:MAG: (2Fe-2S) ferredoxin domain-containing protein [Planctomycetes bacterium]|nr:(2Fe-2S) ferredoxin domain-containing protein [Planctomycetota bacterium]